MADKEPQERPDELGAFRDLENTKRFLEAENGRLRAQIDELTGELEGIEISISSAEAYMDSYEKRRENCVEDLKELDTKRDLLMREIDELYLKIKVAKQDEEMSAKLIETLKDELHDIKTHKGIVNKRLDDIQSGIREISSEKALRVPHVRKYDSTLKDLHKKLMEAQNRMEVSLMLRQK